MTSPSPLARSTRPARVRQADVTLADRLRPFLPRLPDGGMEAVLAALGVAVVDRHSLAMLWELGPHPTETSFAAVAAADAPGCGLAVALEALGRRYPFFGEVSVDLVEAARRMDGEADRFREVLGIVDTADLAVVNAAGKPVDLLGNMYGLLRHVPGKQRLGAFFTPDPIAALLAEFTSGERHYRRGVSAYDPTCGTGGMMLAAALAARADLVDPCVMGWFGIDVDPVAVGLAGLNAIAWGLAPHVWLHVGDSRTDTFVTPAGFAVPMDIILGNPPFGVLPDAVGEPRVVVVDAKRRRQQMGLPGR